MAIIRDLTVQKRLEAERVMREKQLALMLREAHHRIKNTLQIASDILSLQSAASVSEQAAEALREAATRIRALSVVHEWISPDHDVSVIGTRRLLETIVGNLRDTFVEASDPVQFGITVEDHAVTSRQATALALITTELVTNAMRHARPGRVSVQFSIGDEQGLLEVADDGPDPITVEEMKQRSGFGLQLVRLLADEQLGGSFEIDRKHGVTSARVIFPLTNPQADRYA